MTASLMIVLIASLSIIFLLLSEFKSFFIGKAISKTITALCFVGFGFLQGWEDSYSIIVLSGLVLGMLGDVFLIPHNKKAFLIGLISFLFAHILYGYAFSGFFRFSMLWLVLSILPIIMGLAFYRWIYDRLDNFKMPVGVYLIVIHYMLVTAISFYLSQDSLKSLIALLGATLFYLSDFAVARERFVRKSFFNKLWGLPFYFVGQFLIAYSISL